MLKQYDIDGLSGGVLDGEQNLNILKGSSLLCYKRAQSINYYSSTMIVAPAGAISTSMTPCSANNTYQVQTLHGVPCPVTSISNTSLGSSQTKITLDSPNNYYLNFVAETGYLKIGIIHKWAHLIPPKMNR